MNGHCLFCKIANREIKSEIIYEDERMIAFKDINPKADIHFLFIPKKHIDSLNGISSKDANLLGEMLIKIKEVAAKEKIAEDGYRVVINCNRNAGQEVFHLHFHLLGGRRFTWPPG